MSYRYIRGKWTNGDYYDCGVNPDGQLAIDIPLGAFGRLKVEQDEPQVQVDFRYGVDPAITSANVTGIGSVSSDNEFADVATGAQASSSAILETRRFLKYSTGEGGRAYFTAVFDTPATGNNQFVGFGTDNNGLFFGYQDTAFGLLRRSDGVDNFIPQTTWNVDTMDGTGPCGMTLDPSKGNVYSISFQWLGFGQLTFFMECSKSGKLIPVHRIQYTNANTRTSLRNPSFPMRIENVNTTNATDIHLKSPSLAAFTEGKRRLLGLTWSTNNTKTVTSTSFINLFTLRSKTTFNGLDNFVPAFLRVLSASVTGNKTAVIELVKNATLGGTPSFADVNASSVMEVDVAGTTVTGGQALLQIVLNTETTILEELANLEVELIRGDTITVGAALVGAGSTECSCSLTWLEDR